MPRSDRPPGPVLSPPDNGPEAGGNAAADARRRKIERQVYARRTAADREAEARGPASPTRRPV